MLISRWKCNENALNTSVVDDVSSNNGVANANTSLLHTTGKVNGGFNLAGIYRIVVGNPVSLQISGIISIVAWIKFSSTPHFEYIINKGNAYSLWIDTDNTIHFNSSTQSIQTANAYNDGNWHLIIGTIDNGTQKLYIDNGVEEITGGVGYLNDEEVDIVIGDNSGLEGYIPHATIDIIEICNHVLSSDQRSFLWNSGNGTESSFPEEYIVVGNINISLIPESIVHFCPLYESKFIHDTKLYIIVDSNPAKIIEVDIFATPLAYTIYTLNASGEYYENGKNLTINFTDHMLYASCNHGKVVKADLVDLISRIELDVGENVQLYNITIKEDFRYTYIINKLEDLFVIDESTKEKINTKLNFNLRSRKILKTFIDFIFANKINTKFTFLKRTNNMINTRINFNKYEYERIPENCLKREDFGG